MNYLKLELPAKLADTLSEVIGLSIECMQADMTHEEANTIIDPIIADLQLNDNEFKAFLIIMHISIAQKVGSKYEYSEGEIIEATYILNNIGNDKPIDNAPPKELLKKMLYEQGLKEYLHKKINPKCDLLFGFFMAYHKLGWHRIESFAGAHEMLAKTGLPEYIIECLCIMGYTAMEVDQDMDHAYTFEQIKEATIQVKAYFTSMYDGQ